MTKTLNTSSCSLQTRVLQSDHINMHIPEFEKLYNMEMCGLNLYTLQQICALEVYEAFFRHMFYYLLLFLQMHSQFSLEFM